MEDQLHLYKSVTPLSKDHHYQIWFHSAKFFFFFFFSSQVVSEELIKGHIKQGMMSNRQLMQTDDNNLHNPLGQAS